MSEVHNDRIFRTFNRVTFWRGGYVITDGGYPATCYGFDNPIVPSHDYHSVVGEWIESVRKDVERLFGCWSTEEPFRLVKEQCSVLESIYCHCSCPSVCYHRFLDLTLFLYAKMYPFFPQKNSR